MRDTYIISGSLTVQELEWKLNTIMMLIGDRLDAIEGIRPEAPEGYVLTSGAYKAPASYAGMSGVTGILALENGGLGEDVSDYDGLVKISGGNASEVSITTAAETLLTSDIGSALTFQRCLISTLDFNNEVIHQYLISEAAISSDTHGYY